MAVEAQSTILSIDFQRRWPDGFDGYDTVLAELGPLLFASLSRSDQRRTGATYLRGLLAAEGRKSIRNLAGLLGPQTNEQSLHHFINSSTWEWMPVRRALGRYLVRVAPPQAWVVRPMAILKTGRHSVGVDRRFVPARGQVLNVQQAVGVWAAAPRLSAPIGWRLHLSRAWLDDDARRTKALIPDDAEPETLGDCGVETVLESVRAAGLPTRPVLQDLRTADAARVVRRLRAAGQPFLVRIGGMLPLVPATVPAPSRSTVRANPVSARLVLAPLRDLRRPVVWTDGMPSVGGTVRTTLVGASRVALPPMPGESAGAEGELLLLGVGDPGRQWPTELWLTDLVDAQHGALVRLGRLLERVERDFAGVGARVGLQDFGGRSFGGWHRHMTLASAAHAVVAIARADAAHLLGAA